MFRLHTLGGLFLEHDGVRVVSGVAQTKRLALLAYLSAESRAGTTRDKIASLLWPESDAAHSRNALYQAVSAIRRDLGAEVLLGGPTGDLRLNERILTSDVGEFLAAMARGDSERAVASYSGPFLDGVHVRGAPDFERWAEALRFSCAERYREALSDLADRARATGDVVASVRWLRLLAAAGPLDPRTALRLMEALTSAGDVDGAIRHGVLHGEVVRSELETEPDQLVSALVADLRRQMKSGSVPDAARLSPGHPDRVVAGDAEPAPPITGIAIGPVPGPSGKIVARRPSAFTARRLGVGLLLAAAIGVSAFAIAKPWRASPHEQTALDPHRVVVVDFENLTGDSSFNLLGAALGDWVTRGVIETGVARVVDPTSRAMLGRLRNETQALRGKERAIAIARATAAAVVVSGAIYRQGRELAIQTELTDVANDRVLVSLDPVTAPLEDGLRNASVVRERVAGALASAFDARLAAITLPSTRPPTYAAYREFMLGLDAFIAQPEAKALPYFARASELDTTFALPLIWTTFALENASEFKEADSVIALLARRRPFLGTLEELQLRVFQSSDSDEELLLLTRGAELSPGSTWSNNAGAALHNRNRMREAVKYYEQIDPEHGWARTWQPYWLYYSRALHALGDYRAELRLARQYRELGGLGPGARSVEARAAAELGMHSDVLRALGEIPTYPRVDCNRTGDVYQQFALEMRAHHDSAAADSALSSWVALCRRDEQRRAANHADPDSLVAWISSRVWLGIAMYRTNQFAEARQLLTWALGQPEIDPYRQELAHAFLGRMAARAGDRSAAEREMRAIPVESWRDEAYWAADRVAIAALLGDPERAVQELKIVSPHFPYALLHRDPDYASLWSFAPFRAFATPH